jgi:hypothetical protein
MSKKVFVPGEVLRAADVNTYLTGTRNVVINGGFDFWQRGSSFTITSTGVFVSDRWLHIGNGSGSTRTISRQTFAPADIPVQGGDYDFFFRYNQSVAGSGATANALVTRIEDVRTLANGKAVLSFYAKADAARTVGAYLIQRFGSGGSGDVTTASQTFNLTTAWQRFTAVYDVPSISGKTIGDGSYLQLEFTMPLNVVQTVDFFGVQLEEGSVATPFQRNGANIQQELAACQRYYFRLNSINAFSAVGTGGAFNTTQGAIFLPLPTTFRVPATSMEFSSTGDFSLFTGSISSLAIENQNTRTAGIGITGSGLPAGGAIVMRFANTTTGFIAFSAEL